MNTDELYARTTRNRLELADLLDTLGPEQWDAPTLCAGWTVRHLAAHLLQASSGIKAHAQSIAEYLEKMSLAIRIITSRT